MAGEKHTAIILAAGKGSRMQSDIPKQFLLLGGKPLLYYSLHTFAESFIDEIVLVTGAGQEAYCREEIIEKYGIPKVRAIIPGGAERYDSVRAGLEACGCCEYIYIHDGARPFIDAEILERARVCVREYKACAAGMPVKDTIKIVDSVGFVETTPPRSLVWQIQTPQVFSFSLIKEAYDLLYQSADRSGITDDAMVAERMLGQPVRLFYGSYRNIKITTPEDLPLGKLLLEESSGNGKTVKIQKNT